MIEKKETYLIYQYFQSVQCCHRHNIKLINTCSSRLITSHQLLIIQSLNLQLSTTFFIIKIWFLLVLVVMYSHSHQASDESCMQEMYSIFLQQHELILISTDITAHAVLSAVRECIFSRPFSEKSSELSYQNFDSL